MITGARLQLTHPHVAAAVLSICGAPTQGAKRASLLSALAKASSRSVADAGWDGVCARLVSRGVCDEACGRELGKYVWHEWRAEELHKLRTLVTARASRPERQRCLDALSSLEQVISPDLRVISV